MTLSLAFVAPPIVAAAIEGRLPRGFGVRRLMDLPMVWPEQWAALGLTAPAEQTERSIRMTLSLAFVAPPIVAAAIEGRLPRGFGVRRLMDLPMVWSEQWAALGLTAPAER
jgi:hypothetical protein